MESMKMTTKTMAQGISQSSESDEVWKTGPEDPDQKMKEQAENPEEDTGLSHHDLKEAVDDFITMTADARMLSEKCRDYYDGKQWTAEQVAALRKRKQAPIVNNKIKTKLNGLLGLTSVRKGDPKAYPRNQDSDSNAASAATDGLRYVADQNRLNPTFLECADNFFCEGYCGVNVIAEQNPKGETDVIIDQVPWDRLFFDPYSRKHDFSDARGKGFGIWMDKEDIELAFPDADPSSLGEMTTIDTDETFEDRPRWNFKHGRRRRFLVITHYIKCRGKWYMAIYTGGGFLMEPFESPYLDEYKQPDCPLEIEHCYIDRENNRYGELTSFLDLQDEINHRRSKALFLLSQRQTFGNRGSVTNVAKAKMELAKPDGHLEVGQGEFNKDFGILPTGDMAEGQMELLKDAKQEMDSSSYNASLQGNDPSQGTISGIALQRLQQAGMTEIIRSFENFSAFKNRVYRQAWNRIRQAWTKEKWVRVTDDDKKIRWVGFNIQVTMQQFLQETMDNEALPQALRLGASAKMIMLEQQSQQAQQSGQQQDPSQDPLQQLVMTRNKPAELDMDIILDESYDVTNVAQEQLDAIIKFGAQAQFDIIDLLNISNITDKDKLIEKIEKRRKEAAAAAAQQPQQQDPVAMAQAGYWTAKAQAVTQDSQSKKESVEGHLQIKAQDSQSKHDNAVAHTQIKAQDSQVKVQDSQIKGSQVQSENYTKQSQGAADIAKTVAETDQIKLENIRLLNAPDIPIKGTMRT